MGVLSLRHSTALWNTYTCSILAASSSHLLLDCGCSQRQKGSTAQLWDSASSWFERCRTGHLGGGLSCKMGCDEQSVALLNGPLHRNKHLTNGKWFEDSRSHCFHFVRPIFPFWGWKDRNAGWNVLNCILWYPVVCFSMFSRIFICCPHLRRWYTHHMVEHEFLSSIQESIATNGLGCPSPLLIGDGESNAKCSNNTFQGLKSLQASPVQGAWN